MTKTAYRTLLYENLPRFWQSPNTCDWRRRHIDAINNPQGAEQPLVELIRAWFDYADGHSHTYDTGIGQDGFLGDEWEKIGQALLALLNGQSGRLDCGTLDGLIRHVLTAEGFDAGI